MQPGLGTGEPGEEIDDMVGRVGLKLDLHKPRGYPIALPQTCHLLAFVPPMSKGPSAGLYCRMTEPGKASRAGPSQLCCGKLWGIFGTYHA